MLVTSAWQDAACRSSPRCRRTASRYWSWPSRCSRRRGCRPAGRPPPRPRRSASSAAVPSSSLVRLSSSTWAKSRLPARLPDLGARRLRRPRRARRSRPSARVSCASPCSTCHSLAAMRHGGARLRVLVALPGGRQRVHHRRTRRRRRSRCCARMKSRSLPGRPPPGGQASRRAACGCAFGKGKPFDIAVALARAVGLQIVPPAVRQVGPQILERWPWDGCRTSTRPACVRLAADGTRWACDVHGAALLQGDG